jgi:5-methylthioadenosine/S-adenosylhomocysteine deaminase
MSDAQHGRSLSAEVGSDGVTAPSPGRRLLLKGGTLVTMDPALGDLPCGDVLIEGSRIAAIAPSIDAPDATVIDASGHVILPGFCDPHIHCWEGVLGRLIPNNLSTVAEDTGRPEPSPHPTRSYMHVLHQVFAPVFRPEDVYIGTLLSLLNALSAGITTVCDNMHNARSSEHADESVRAMFESGVRGVHAHGRPRYGSWAPGFPADAYRLRERYFSAEDQLCTMRLYALGRDSTAEIEQLVAARRDLDLWLTFDSGIDAQPLEDLYGGKAFDGRETINHGNFVSAPKMRMLADGGARVNVCPRIESQFRFGHVPYMDWVDVGVHPGLSNDNPATYPISMFHEMRALYAFQRTKAHQDGSRWPTLREVLAAATVRGADNCGLGDRTGSLTPGKQADIVLLRADGLELHPLNNAVCSVVQGGDAGLVDTVLVGGRVRKWRGRMLGVDLARIRRLAEQSRDHLLAAVSWPHSRIDFSD